MAEATHSKLNSFGTHNTLALSLAALSGAPRSRKSVNFYQQLRGTMPRWSRSLMIALAAKSAGVQMPLFSWPTISMKSHRANVLAMVIALLSESTCPLRLMVSLRILGRLIQASTSSAIRWVLSRSVPSLIGNYRKSSSLRLDPI
jgi:hypothetical protein